MLEILQFYVPGFWAWAGITVGLWSVGTLFRELADGLVSGYRRTRG